jgi:hypothetical protein
MIDCLLMGQTKASISSRFGIDENDLTDLLERTQGLARKLKRFCGEIGWISFEKIIGNFITSALLADTVQVEQLMTIPTMTSKAARVLYDSGWKTLSDLLEAAPEDVITRLHLSMAFETQVDL